MRPPSFNQERRLDCSRFCSWCPWCETRQPGALPKLPTRPVSHLPLLLHPDVSTQNISHKKTPHIHHCLALTGLKKAGDLQQVSQSVPSDDRLELPLSPDMALQSHFSTLTIRGFTSHSHVSLTSHQSAGSLRPSNGLKQRVKHGEKGMNLKFRGYLIPCK